MTERQATPTTLEPLPAPPAAARLCALLLGGYALVAGVVALLGWAMDVQPLAAWDRGDIVIQPNAALAGAAAGLAAVLLAFRASAPIRHTARAAAGLAATIGLLTLMEHVTRGDVGIDSVLLFGRDWGAQATTAPGRMGVPACTSWMLLGLGLLLASTRAPRARAIAAALGAAAAGISLLSVVGYLYQAGTLYTLPKLTAIAFPTATMILALAIALLAVLPEQPPALYLREPTASGVLARRALPLVVLVPIVVGWLRGWGSDNNLYDQSFGTALRTIVEVVLLCGLLWWAVAMVRSRERLLRASNELNRGVIDGSEDCIKVLDLSGRIVDVNTRGRALLRMDTPAQWSTLSWPDLWPAGHQAAARAAVAAAAAGGRGELAAPLTMHDGATRWWEVTLTPIAGEGGRPHRLLAVSRDVTARRTAELAARDGERRLRELIDAIPAAVYTTDAEGRITYFNRAAAEFAGREPALGEPWCVTWKLEHDDGTPLPHDQCPMAVALRQGFPVRGAEAVAVRPDGSRVRFAPYPTPLLDERGTVVGGINMLVDVTERRRQEIAAARLAAIVESSDDAIVTKDLNGIIQSWNRGAERIFGYTQGEAIGRHITLIIPPDRRAEEDQVIGRIRRGEKVDHFETRRLTMDGRLVDVSITVSPLRDSQGRVVGASKIARDISERVRAEAALRTHQAELARHRDTLEQMVQERTRQLEESAQRLRMSERLASLGTLSAGVGHDMGNLLIPLRMRIESLEAQDLPEAAREDITAIRTCADYLQKLGGGLRSLAVDPGRPGPRETVELLAWWDEAQVLCRTVLPRSVTLTAQLPAAPCWAAIPRAALTQAVFNLVQNAGDALRSRTGGAVTVRVDPLPGAVELTVSDDGPGMAPEVLARCMEPFFTTKTRGISTGLGLALVHGLVTDAGGTIDARSQPGQGAAFTLRLPSAPAPSDPPPARLHAAVEVADPRLRAIVHQQLAFMGVGVTTNGHPADLRVLDRPAAAERPGQPTVLLAGGGGHPQPPSIRAVRASLQDAVARVRANSPAPAAQSGTPAPAAPAAEGA